MAANEGHPKRHPRYHYDINQSQDAAFKIGLYKQLTPDKFVEFLDDTRDRKSLKDFSTSIRIAITLMIVKELNELRNSYTKGFLLIF